MKVFFLFELDFTLWDCGDIPHSRLHLPLQKNMHMVKDQAGKLVNASQDIFRIMDELKEAGYGIGYLASSPIPECTEKLLSYLGLEPYPDKVIFTDQNRKDQFKAFMEETGATADKMIYFDSSRENVEIAKSLNIISFLIPNEGLTYDTYKLALKTASMKTDLKELKIIWGTQ